MGRLIRSSEFDGANNLIQRIEQLYDKANRLEKQSWIIDGDSYSESYTYNDPVVGADASVRPQDGSLASVTTATGDRILYSYDSLKRLGGTTVENAAGEPLFRTGYSYKAGAETNQTTNQVLVYTTWDPNYSNILSYRYSYDAVGNITKIEDVTNTARTLAEYTYDELNQLTQEKIYNYNSNGTYTSTDTYVYTYDSAGNILTETKDNVIVKTYGYDNNDWKDLLTEQNGNLVIYEGQVYDSETDEIDGAPISGNPILYTIDDSACTLTWENGNQLTGIAVPNERAVGGALVTTYEYDADGIRTAKYVPTGLRGLKILHYYTTQNGKVVRESYSNNVLDFIYDVSGNPFAMRYSVDGGSTFDTFYYVLNLQGDVVAMLDEDGECVAQYTYNAWGEILTATGDMAGINPIRYRGYYYDTDMGLYYLQSRYYDPANHRFINDDSYLSTGQGILGCNMFAYCRNNPVTRSDSSGYSDKVDEDGDGDVWEIEKKGGGTSRSGNRDTSGDSYPGSSSQRNSSGGGSTTTGSGKAPSSGYKAPNGGGGVSDTRQVGDTTITFGHGGRHLEGSGIAVSQAHTAIANDVVNQPVSGAHVKYFDLIVGGYTLHYGARLLSANLINIGTYYLVFD